MRTGTVSYRLEDLKKGVIIPIGFVGENDFTRVIFDAEEVYKNYPAAQVSMKVQPPKGSIYPATVTRDGNSVIWQVKAADVANRGNGELQMTFTSGETVIKTYIARTDVKRSLAGNGTAPDPVQDWIDEAEDVLEDVEAAEIHQPMIGLDGYWYTWNQETGEYEKTNTKAQGADGHSPVLTSSKSGKTTTIYSDGTKLAQIQDGEDGQGADVIDDTAGEGDTDKTWSADKLTDEFGDVLNAIHGIDYSGKLLKNPVKSALLNLFDHVVFTDGNAQIYIDALKDAWKPEGTLDSITAVFTQGSAVIYTNDSLDALRQYLVVTGTYIKDSVEFEDEISDYALSGTLTAGTSTITVTYGEETTTFTVDVTDQSGLPSAYQRVEYIESTGTQFILFSDLIDNTAANLSKYEFDIDCECVGWNGTNATNIVVGISSDPGCWIGYNHNIDKILIGTDNGCYFSDKVNDRNQYHYSFTNGYGNVERDDGAVITREFNGTGPEARLCLFSTAASASNPTENKNFRSLFKLYSFYLTREGTPKYNMIPCYRKSDDVIGLYNTVDETFYTNNGTGTFNKGSDVNV